jgi:hypothetical protein
MKKNAFLIKHPTLAQYATAYTMYMKGNYSLKEICKETRLHYDVLKNWHTKHRWAKKRTQMLQETIQRVDEEFCQLMHTARLSVAKRHLQTSEKLEKMIRLRIEESEKKGLVLPERTIAVLAKALRDSAEVSGNASSLNKKQESNQDSAINRPLVAVGIHVQQAEPQIKVVHQVEDLAPF